MPVLIDSLRVALLQLTPSPGTTAFAVRLNNAFVNDPQWILSSVPQGEFQSTSTDLGISFQTCTRAPTRIQSFTAWCQTINSAHLELAFEKLKSEELVVALIATGIRQGSQSLPTRNSLFSAVLSTFSWQGDLSLCGL